MYQIIENTSFFEKIKDCLNNINTNNCNYLKFIFNLFKSDKILDKFSKRNKRIKRDNFLDFEDLLIDKISQNAKEEKNENEEKLYNKNIINRDKIPIDYKNGDILIKKE